MNSLFSFVAVLTTLQAFTMGAVLATLVTAIIAGFYIRRLRNNKSTVIKELVEKKIRDEQKLRDREVELLRSQYVQLAIYRIWQAIHTAIVLNGTKGFELAPVHDEYLGEEILKAYTFTLRGPLVEELRHEGDKARRLLTVRIDPKAVPGTEVSFNYEQRNQKFVCPLFRCNDYEKLADEAARFVFNFQLEEVVAS